MRSDVKRVIRQARDDETARKTRHVLTAIVVIAIGTVLLLRLNTLETNQMSYGSIDRLSYDLPVHSSPDVIFSQQKILNATCYSNGTLECVSPVVESYFVTNIRTNITRYEQYVHMQLKNIGWDAKVSSVYFGDNSCTPANDFGLRTGEVSNRLDFLCPSVSIVGKFSGTWHANYTEGGAAKQSWGILKTV